MNTMTISFRMVLGKPRVWLASLAALVVVLALGARPVRAEEGTGSLSMGGSGVLVVSASLGISSASRGDLQKVLTGKSDTLGGKKVRIVLPPADSPEMQFLADFVGVPVAGYKRMLLERAFRGEIQKPDSADSADQAKQLIAGGGRVGVVPAGQAGGGVVAVTVN